MPKTYGYLRVSTQDQDLNKNKFEVLELANTLNLGKVEWVEERISGKKDWQQRKLADLLATAESGDTIIVSELSRLGRKMVQIMEVLSIATRKEVSVYAIKGNWKLDNSMVSQMLAFAYSIAAQIEGELISSRTKEALAAKKASGVQLGRPKGSGKSKLDEKEVEIRALLANGSTKKFIANRYGCSQSTLHEWLTKKGINQKQTPLLNRH